MMAPGLFGLHIMCGDRFNEPTADYTCRCGHSSSAKGAAAVIRFAETAAADHRAVCPLKSREGTSGGAVERGTVDWARGAGVGERRRSGRR